MAKALTTQEIRDEFIRFFAERDHRHIPSSPLVPLDDPSLLFTSAGMVQFKPMFAAKGKLPYTRATSVQKCFRATDLEVVGHTPRHLSFFEMLGNFSFGDYFKREAIVWAWEFVVDVLEMNPSKLWASVYLDDDEAAGIWEKETGVPSDRIVRLGKDDNFWALQRDLHGSGAEVRVRAPRLQAGMRMRPLPGVLEPRLSPVRHGRGRQSESPPAPRH
jgi:alanyl-tRNA synthetase